VRDPPRPRGPRRRWSRPGGRRGPKYEVKTEVADEDRGPAPERPPPAAGPRRVRPPAPRDEPRTRDGAQALVKAARPRDIGAGDHARAGGRPRPRRGPSCVRRRIRDVKTSKSLTEPDLSLTRYTGAQNCVGRQAARAPRRMRTHTAVGPAGERASARERAGMFSRVASVIASAAGALLVPARARGVHGPIRLNPEFDTSGRDVWPHTALPRTPIFMLHAVFKYEIVAAARSRYQRPGRRQDACRRPRRR
jgi:hypothetical protein